jgi:hypothetical protein
MSISGFVTNVYKGLFEMKNKSKLIESYSLTFCVIVLHGYASSE